MLLRIFLLTSVLSFFAPSTTGNRLLLESKHKYVRRRSFDGEATSGVLCRLTVVDTMYVADAGSSTHTQELHCIPVVEDKETNDLFPVSCPIDPASWTQLREGHLHAFLRGATLGEDGLHVPKGSFCEISNHVPGYFRKLQQKSSTQGVKSLAVVRISTVDSTPLYSATQLRDGIFRSNVSLVTQYEACSFGKLQWMESPIGVMDVSVNYTVSSFSSPIKLAAAAQQQISIDLGIDDLSSVADKVIMCMPPGLGDWAGNAALNHWRAQFNNEWCLSLSATVHELGHTLGLLHSNKDGVMYGDTTGMMAWGYLSHDWPKKCFNGQNNWQLGWYGDRQLRTDPRYAPGLIKVATFVDYKKTDINEPVVVQIAGKYYMQYNRAKEFNDGTGEMRNQITITTNGDNGTDCVAGLIVGEEFAEDYFEGSGNSLVVKVCDVVSGTNDSPDYMIVSVGMGQNYCDELKSMDLVFMASDPEYTPIPTAAPTAVPTAAPTALPTCGPTKSPTLVPTTSPTAKPTSEPTNNPTKNPTSVPTKIPTTGPTYAPTKMPTASPTLLPTKRPTGRPTKKPTIAPTSKPTRIPTTIPTTPPTRSPTAEPTFLKTRAPTLSPTVHPTRTPTLNPTTSPTPVPSVSALMPSFRPTNSVSTLSPSHFATNSPTDIPIAAIPSRSPTQIRTSESSPSNCVAQPACGFGTTGCTFIPVAVPSNPPSTPKSICEQGTAECKEASAISPPDASNQESSSQVVVPSDAPSDIPSNAPSILKVEIEVGQKFIKVDSLQKKTKTKEAETRLVRLHKDSD